MLGLYVQRLGALFIDPFDPELFDELVELGLELAHGRGALIRDVFELVWIFSNVKKLGARCIDEMKGFISKGLELGPAVVVARVERFSVCEQPQAVLVAGHEGDEARTLDRRRAFQAHEIQKGRHEVDGADLRLDPMAFGDLAIRRLDDERDPRRRVIDEEAVCTWRSSISTPAFSTKLTSWPRKGIELGPEPSMAPLGSLHPGRHLQSPGPRGRGGARAPCGGARAPCG